MHHRFPGVAEHACQVYRLIAQQGHVRYGLYHQRNDLRPHLIFKKAGNKFLLGLGQLLFVLDEYLLLFQLRDNVEQGAVKFGLLRHYGLLYLLQYLIRIGLQVHFGGLAQQHHFIQRRYTHPEKFIQVVGEYTQEPQPVVDVVGWVIGLLQYTGIECQPADVTYYGRLGSNGLYRRGLGSLCLGDFCLG